ncbi:TspO/MBR family protein [Aurantimonas sp. VKM B-3413]|uniref:TspO/MBR family protein n=1 Tax=Aurantimonas sp. VKM B-3413 TaxID=2779401 RepID=UPI001E457BB0|nr:TspO/MBR family protein [Aurantimonas sp. VKM B-3413]MCB8839992.1 tryptophan-rich sensory protein [Aurantimonas sp. VKM B-3413]
MTRRLALPFFLLVTVGGGALLGLVVDTGSWFQGLAKPVFNPPDWVFAPVWGTLYILIGIAGWRVWRVSETRLQRLWWRQLTLNFAWPPIFFAAHLLAGGLVVILALLAAIIAFMAASWRHERVSALLFVPYLAWVAYASLLNGAIWWLN